jgi:tetratricopeptide (TPR) repeat protein
MLAGLRSILPLALWLCCEVMPPFDGETASPAALRLWQAGQEAMRQGRPAEAIDCYEQSLAADPGMMRNYLSLAAAYLEAGEEAKACPHLARYVAARPEHLSIRLHYADLLVRLHRAHEARTEFERYVVDAQEQGEPASRNLLHCHSLLMEIAEDEEDEYSEHLNRGIGLLLLARQRAELPEEDGSFSTEGLLCKAAGELALAHMQRPAEARPCWYLSRAWSDLAQRQPAQHWLHEADAIGPWSDLTPAEQRDLHRACLRAETEGVRK